MKYSKTKLDELERKGYAYLTSDEIERESKRGVKYFKKKEERIEKRKIAELLKRGGFV